MDKPSLSLQTGTTSASEQSSQLNIITAPKAAAESIITELGARPHTVISNKAGEAAAASQRPVVLIITHSDPSIINVLRRQFDLLGFQIEVEIVACTPTPISPGFAKKSVEKVRQVISSREITREKIKVIQYEINCGKSGQTPLIKEMVREFITNFPSVYIITFSAVEEHAGMVQEAKKALIDSGSTSPKQAEYFVYAPKSELGGGRFRQIASDALAEASTGEAIAHASASSLGTTATAMASLHSHPAGAQTGGSAQASSKPSSDF